MNHGNFDPMIWLLCDVKMINRVEVLEPRGCAFESHKCGCLSTFVVVYSFLVLFECSLRVGIIDLFDWPLIFECIE